MWVHKVITYYNTMARMVTADYGNQIINCQLVLALGSQAIQRFNFISTNFEPSTTDNVNWFCYNTDNSTLVLHCISKYMRSS